MIIDALRSDFAFGEYNFFPNVLALMKKGHGIHFRAEMQPPTVTLPRIKALVTGSSPSFADVVLNFAATAMEEDSVIMQLKKEKRPMVFFGDDTWLKLFPGYFERSDGTTSFFVADFTEVDLNVTRHLQKELTNPEWELMILHYLGLDHIGHTTGPNSPLVQPKLKEMDDIILQIYSAMKHWNESSILIVCGDHGMSDQGGHGGGSVAEISVPLIFLSPHYFHKNASQEIELISQIDLCPTLSVLLGVPIPKNNLGKVILEALLGYTECQKVLILINNAKQVIELYKNYWTDYEKDSTYRLFMMAEEKYHSWWDSQNVSDSEYWEENCSSLLPLLSECLTFFSLKIQSHSTQYDDYSIAVSMTLLWMLFLVLAVSMLQKDNLIQKVTFSTLASQIVVILGSVLLSHIIMCTAGGVPSELMCQTTFLSVGVQIIVGLILFLCLLYLLNKVPNCEWSSVVKWIKCRTVIEVFLAAGTCLHIVTYLSSSYIEEEHQTFYFLTIGVHIVLSLQLILSYLHTSSLHNEGNIESNSTLAFNGRHSPKSHDQNSHHLNTRTAQPFHCAHNSTNCCSAKDLFVLLAYVFVILSMLRVLRRWNQTGNKWLDNPDIGDWLVLPENKLYLSLCVAFSLIVIGVTRGHQMKSIQSMFLNLSLTTIYLYHVATGKLFAPKSTFLSVRGIIEARATFFLIGAIFISSLMPSAVYNLETPKKIISTIVQEGTADNLVSGQSDKSLVYKNKFRNTLIQKIFFGPRKHFGSESSLTVHQRLNGIFSSFLSYMCLVGRPHNIPVVAMLSLMEQMIIPVLINVSLKLPYVLLYCHWMGQAFFFFQGNSNSLSTVDLAAGYTGLNEFIPVLTGTHICLSTYSGTILWSLTFFKIFCLTYKERKYSISKAMEISGTLLLLNLSLRTSLYTLLIALQRHHLFIWTVFSPKLLYECVYTFVASLLLLLTMIVSKCMMTEV
ncbi:GPI ethanolamine phosphate transferase 2 [Biomphalaria pfeifferi]|uniref:GPI ethanolamine phosphate transferase 2 n=1 Tax=Biomphalaria pfeifferi TaxID=112525 RepID=A0AAD8FJ18_BIOPF|nr:GPI ethanolamine phosphate transferase 2 [Biomphalaria pfeifferi]